MNKLDNLLSFLYPLSIETAESDVNSFLEVVYKDGRYQLNSANANYSYGGLYELFKLVFKSITIDWENVNSLLILGFGTGCIVPLIQKYKSNTCIVGVEIDEKVIELGLKYFNVEKLENTRVICDNAYSFVTGTNEKFDLIVIDVFVNLNVPREVETKGFLLAVKNILNTNGQVIFNKLTPNKSYKKQIPELKQMYMDIFSDVNTYPFMGTGQVFVARNS